MRDHFSLLYLVKLVFRPCATTLLVDYSVLGSSVVSFSTDDVALVRDDHEAVQSRNLCE